MPVDDIVRTAYPTWTGWRWRDQLSQWTRPEAPPCRVTARLQLAAMAWCTERADLIDDALNLRRG